MNRKDDVKQLHRVATIVVATLFCAPGTAELIVSGNQFWTQDSSGLLDGAEEEDRFGWAVAAGDFDQDGYDDLAVSVWKEDLGSIVDAGAVQVLYGSSEGLTSVDEFWHQDVTGVIDVAEADDGFGWALATGDFNHDGYDDLAVGIPWEDLPGSDDAGAVQVLYGSPVGLSGNQLWHQDQPGVVDQSEPGDRFGYALAAGDFDNDGYADLAIGVYAEDVGAVVDAGAVHVLYGSPTGLAPAGNQLWHQNVAGTLGGAEPSDFFGEQLTTADFDGDGFADLAVGIPQEDLGSLDAGGAVHVFYGTSAGLAATDDQVWTQGSPGVLETAEALDFFGSELAAGDFDGDGFAELAVAATGEDLGAIENAGVVHVIPGGTGGLTADGDQLWHQGSPGIPGLDEPFDAFGLALCAGDFNRDGRADLAIGVPFKSRGADSRVGTVLVVHGGAGGLSAAGSRSLHQALPGLLDAEPGDDFGNSLACGDFDGSAPASDLAIGIPGEGVSGADDAGAVQILYDYGIFSDGFESDDSSA